MDTSQDPKITMPVKGKLSLMYFFSFLIAILMAILSLAGLGYRTDIYPNEELMQNFLPNDVVNLAIGLPILLISMGLARGKKLTGLLFWTGALFYIFYNYLAYIFAMPLNWAFPGYIILTVLSIYTLAGLIAAIDGKAVQDRLRGAVPEKFAGGILAGFGLLLFLRGMGVIVQALMSGALPAETELAVNISDLMITPAWIIGGVLLWRRKELGYVCGLGLLFQGSMLFIALIVFLLLQPLLTNASFAVVDVIVIFLMGLVCFIPFGLFVRGTMGKRKHISG